MSTSGQPLYARTNVGSIVGRVKALTCPCDFDLNLDVLLGEHPCTFLLDLLSHLSPRSQLSRRSPTLYRTNGGCTHLPVSSAGQVTRKAVCLGQGR